MLFGHSLCCEEFYNLTKDNMALSSIRDKLFSEETKSTLKWVAAGATLFGIAFLGKKLYQKLTTKSPKKQQSQSSGKTKKQGKTAQRLNTKITQYSEFYFDKDLELQYIESTLPQNPSVEDIYLNSPLIARDQFIKYTREIRKRRRLIRKTSEEQYINVILTYHTEIQELLLRSRIELLQYLNMDPEVFENMQQNYEAIEDLRALNRKSQQLLKNKLISETKQKLISDQKLQQIIQQQLHFIHNCMYDRLRQKLQKELNISQNQILIVVESLLEDIIYERFGYEMEDVVRKMKEVGYNARELNEARRKMEIDIGDFNFDSVESLGDPQSEYSEENINQNMKGSVKTVEKSISLTSQP